MRDTSRGPGPKILDPVCDMIVDVDDARDHGLTLTLDGREYAFCGPGCQVTFTKSPARYRVKVDAWMAARPPTAS